MFSVCIVCFLFQAEDGIRDGHVTGVQTCLFRSFEERGFETNTPGKLTLDELKAILPDYHAMVVRSSTTVDKDLLKIGRTSCREKELITARTKTRKDIRKHKE